MSTTSDQIMEFVQRASEQRLDGTGEAVGAPALQGEYLAAAISTVARLAAHEMDLVVAEKHMECQKDGAPTQAFGNYN